MSKKPAVALTRKELYRRVWSKPMSAVAKEVGLSGNALAKICNRLLVPYPPRGYWMRSNAGKKVERPPLPAAPEIKATHIITPGSRAASRRTRTRLDPEARREQLMQVAEQLILENGVHAATMKRIAAIAGISETQAYNYFASREQLFVELARREFARIRDARQEDVRRSRDHYERITRMTRTYLRHIGQRGTLLQTLLSHPDVRAMLRAERRKEQRDNFHAHADELVRLYGIPKPLALGTTVVLTTVCLRAGKIIADGRIPVETAERLCLAMVVQGSRDLVSRG
ncbi:MAG TPA: TetR/AcrR family transcriptional regulator [Steroidobacteraceae bacterium]